MPQKKKEKGRARKPHRRREFVVQNVLRCAREELAARGPLAFRIENVARAADVNKTTIYRRWPTKEKLVRAAVAKEAKVDGESNEKATENGRAKFTELSRRYWEWMNSEVGRGFSRIGRGEVSDPELRRVMRAWLAERRKPLEAFARARGKRAGLAADVFVDAWAGALKEYAGQRAPPEKIIRALGDLLLAAI